MCSNTHKITVLKKSKRIEKNAHVYTLLLPAAGKSSSCITLSALANQLSGFLAVFKTHIEMPARILAEEEYRLFLYYI